VLEGHRKRYEETIDGFWGFQVEAEFQVLLLLVQLCQQGLQDLVGAQNVLATLKLASISLSYADD